MAYIPPEKPTERFARFDPGPILDDSSNSQHDGMELDNMSDVLRIAIDFGTTFSSVAYTRTPASGYSTSLMDIACIARYPGDRPLPVITQAWEPRQDVPTELGYPQAAFEDCVRPDNSSLSQDEDQLDHEALPESDASSALSVSGLDREQTPEEVLKLSGLNRAKSPKAVAWGFEVQNQFATEDVPQACHRHIAKIKLLLAKAEELLLDKPRGKGQTIEDIRTDVVAELEKLKKLRLIRVDTDVITHFLENLFFHTKKELQQLDRLEPAVKVEFILCVPAEWSSRACRVMQNSMAEAAESSGLGVVKDGSLDNLFIVSEPESAASCIMAECDNDIFCGETIVILDAGGGTVDGVTYEVSNSRPLRMSAEVVPPKTEVCGASCINEKYAQFLLHKLKDEKYLEKNGKTIQSIVNRKVIEFENTTKRIWDLNDPHCSIEPIWIDDLQPSQKDRQLQLNRLEITAQDVERIYRFSLKGAVTVLKDQLELAKANGHAVQKVLLTGGFGQSPFLQSHLRRFLAKQKNYTGGDIPLLVPKAASTAVARGAILRASDKKLGPARKSFCSYGFLRSEPYDPEGWLAHQVTKPRTDPVDGEEYVHNTIDWLFQKVYDRKDPRTNTWLIAFKGEELEVGQERKIVVKHTFPTNREHLICKEVLFVSDDFKESHYRRRHPMNKGAEVAGSISVDMTFLKTEEKIKPQPVHETSAFFSKKKKVWLVEFDLVVIVDGRNLVYEARWPILKEGADVMVVKQTVCAKGQTCIAATFRPGTA